MTAALRQLLRSSNFLSVETITLTPTCRVFLAEGGGARPSTAIPSETLNEEYELVKNAFFTLPEDQSGWLYHRWLLSNTVAAAQAARGSPEVCSAVLEACDGFARHA